MKKVISIGLIIVSSLAISGCNGKKDITTGVACSGTDNKTLVETMTDQCKAGDAIATKYPGYFCDFNYSIAYNDYNSAFCIYSGKQKEERTTMEAPSKT